MRIMDFLNEKAVCADLTSTNKEDVIREMVELLVKAQVVKEKEKIVKILLEREALGSTGIGQGVAIPHGKSMLVKDLTAAFGLSQQGVNYDSLDGEPVYIFFLLLAPEHSAGPHLKALARISRLLKDKYFRDTLRAARDEKTVLKIIRQEDAKK
ncbi:MAG: PTS sugar transporter subunit IIA [Candidatus Omnitrophica bacterium]|nr:PTS sugar transporter subunit IIA [Candidatus Omnitrophota bacterium]